MISPKERQTLKLEADASESRVEYGTEFQKLRVRPLNKKVTCTVWLVRIVQVQYDLVRKYCTVL